MEQGHPELTRDFVATAIIANGGRAVLLFHKKLKRWLPPGGHIDHPELPDQAAVREAREETGLRIALICDYEPAGFDHALPRPAGIQLENISPGHQHIDLIYLAYPLDGTTLVSNDESTALGWFTLEEMATMGVSDEVRAWCQKAIDAELMLRGGEQA